MKWPGGKRRLARHILPLLPRHTTYVECFGGGIAILMAKPPSECEVINDINSDLINFYRVTKYHRDELVRELQGYLHSRELFRAFLAHPGETDIQRAARWICVNRMSFGGKMRTYGYSVQQGAASHANFVRQIETLSQRLDKVFIENREYPAIFKAYDRPATCFYLDPPYTFGGQENYDTWGEERHRELREHIGALTGKWVLSYNDAPLIRQLYKGCAIHEVARTLGIDNRKGKPGTMTELIIHPRKQ